MFEKQYDELYDEVDLFLKEVNPCNVCDGKCLRAQQGGKNFCCGTCGEHEECKYLGENGCTANKPLLCKTWLCYNAIRSLTQEQNEKYIELSDKVRNLLDDFYKYFRTSKEDVLKIKDLI